MVTRFATALIVTALLAPRSASADGDGYGNNTGIAPLPVRDIKPITIVVPGERTTNSKLVLGGLAGGGVLLGALGVYFHLDASSASDDVSADSFTGEAWSPAKQDLVDRANSSRAWAIGSYAAGGALLVGAIVYWIVTEPADETIVIQPKSAATPTIVPTQGGAVLGGMWSF